MAAKTEKDQAFVEYVVEALVDNPKKVKITRSVDDRGVLLELEVDPSDMGKIIGKAGATAKSIRTLLRVLGAKDDARYNLKIIEPEGSEKPQKKEDEPKKDDVKSDDAEAPAEDAAEEAPKVEEEAAETDDTDSKAEDIKAKAREGIEDLDTDI